MGGVTPEDRFFTRRLSGGEQQRVAIARAIVTNPSILLADEPTGNLDQEISLEIMEMFRRLNSGTTILVASHNQMLLERYARNVLYLKKGTSISCAGWPRSGSPPTCITWPKMWANFKVQRAVNLLSLFIVIFTFFVIDIFFLTKVNLDKLTAKTLTGFQVEAYFGSPLPKDLPERSLAWGRKKEVEKAELILPERARVLFLEAFPDLKSTLDELPENPFPPSIRVTFRSGTSLELIRRDSEELSKQEGVEKVRSNLSLLEKISGVRRLVTLVSLFLGGILLFTSFFTIVNIVKIVAYSRKEEVAILKMVGASNLYIELPLVMNGVLLGFVGAMAAYGLFRLTLILAPSTLGRSPVTSPRSLRVTPSPRASSDHSLPGRWSEASLPLPRFGSFSEESPQTDPSLSLFPGRGEAR